MDQIATEREDSPTSYDDGLQLLLKFFKLKDQSKDTVTVFQRVRLRRERE